MASSNDNPAREYPTAITGTWSDLESWAWYVYENTAPGEPEWDLAEAVLVLIGQERAHSRGC